MSDNYALEMIVNGSLDFWTSKIYELGSQGRISVDSFPVNSNIREVEITNTVVSARARTVQLQGKLIFNPNDETTTIRISIPPYWETIILQLGALLIFAIAILISTTPPLGIVLIIAVIALPILLVSFYVRSATYNRDCARLLDKVQLAINKARS